MRKKYLLGQNSQLHAILENEHQKNKGLEIKNSELIALVKEKDHEISELKRQLSDIELRCSELSDKNSELVEQIDVQKAEAPLIQVHSEEHQVLPEKIQPVSLAMCSSEAEEYGAKSIGRISVKAAVLSNLLAASGDNNAHDLLTLTLGRTEVFKGEVLSTVRSDYDIADKRGRIDQLEAKVTEYFDNIKGQLQ